MSSTRNSKNVSRYREIAQLLSKHTKKNAVCKLCGVKNFELARRLAASIQAAKKIKMCLPEKSTSPKKRKRDTIEFDKEQIPRTKNNNTENDQALQSNLLQINEFEGRKVVSR